MSDRKSMSELLAMVTRQAGGEAPSFMLVNIRDWWILKRGPRWRYPLPERRTFKPLPKRGALWKILKGRGGIDLPATERRAFVPSVFRFGYTAYGTLPAWINGARRRGRMKRAAFPMRRVG